MASTGTRGPKPWTQHRASTIFLRVPSADWTAVRHGKKREFRAESGKVSQLWNAECPVPVVAYKLDARGRYDSALMVLEGVWREPMGAISPESLAAEGFESSAAWRRYWCVREKRRFRPLHFVTAYRVRPWRESDRRELADVLLDRLYGEFLPSHSVEATSVHGSLHHLDGDFAPLGPAITAAGASSDLRAMPDI